MGRKLTIVAGVLGLVCLPSLALASLYSEDFEVDPTLNWTVNDPGLSDILADFYYDYSAIGVPPAPNGPATTRGLKMTCNNSGGVFSGFSVSPTGESFGGNYVVTADMWLNYVGPLGPGGSGTTQLAEMGIGTAGNVAVWPGSAPKESVMFGTTLDGGSSVDYRAYSSVQPTGYPDADPVFAAGAHTGNRNNTDPYYTAAFPGGQAAPAAQVLSYPGQTGVTDAGEVAFAWHEVEIEVLNDMATWSIDGTPIATIDLTTVTLGGGNILFGHSDTNSSSSTDPNDFLLNVTLIDNIVVTPEPATLALLGAGVPLLLRRRR
jgi:hypothetical protein